MTVTSCVMRDATYRLSVSGIKDNATIIPFAAINFNGIQIHLIVAVSRGGDGTIRNFSNTIGYFPATSSSDDSPTFSDNLDLELELISQGKALDNVRDVFHLNVRDVPENGYNKVKGRKIDGALLDRFLVGGCIVADVRVKVRALKSEVVDIDEISSTDIAKGNGESAHNLTSHGVGTTAMMLSPASHNSFAKSLKRRRIGETSTIQNSMLTSARKLVHGSESSSPPSSSTTSKNHSISKTSATNGLEEKSVQTEKCALIASPDGIIHELKCKSCYEVMQPPIYMCREGHSVCKKCTYERCQKCKSRIGTSLTNKGLEGISQHIYFPCDAKGCSEVIVPAKKEEHSLTCINRKIRCVLCSSDFKRVGTCDWEGVSSMMAHHLSNVHKMSMASYVRNGAVNDKMEFKMVARSAHLIVMDDIVFKLCCREESEHYYLCLKLFGTQTKARRHRFVVSVESRDPSIVYRSQFESIVHCDLENRDGKCIALDEKVLRKNGCLKYGELHIVVTILRN